MSGRRLFTDEGFSRRSFLLRAAALVGAGALLAQCRPGKNEPVKGGIMGAAAAVGHRLITMDFPAPSSTIHQETVIAGGGIAGLSAARWLHKNNSDFLLFELDNEAGGNSASGSNEVSAYPWGAHYLPLPNPDQEDLLQFLREHDVITGYDDKGVPLFNDYYLCFDPEERLYIHGQWQEGLIPTFGVPVKDRREIERFLALMEKLRSSKGNDNKYAFAIPVDWSSQDDEFTSIDKLSMKAYLQQEGFSSEYLLWYIDYCCRDDFGTSLSDTSAWAGIHYFASRRSVAANADAHTVLTWPEGNGWLVKKLRGPITNKIKTGCVVFNVEVSGSNVLVDYFDVYKNISTRIVAEKCIMATPQFITKRVVKHASSRSDEMYKGFTYAPWMVANITVENLVDKEGVPLSWDNVFYQSPSLGYVNSTHQSVGMHHPQKVLTYYRPLSEKDPATARMDAHQRSHADWAESIIEELNKAHRDVRKSIKSIDIWLWGHGMIRPVPGFIWGKERLAAASPVDEKIFFANSDLSGLSIFEEAFYHGIRAAKESLLQKA